jgi:hypothetical protein
LFVGLSFGKVIEISNLAWSRDNGDSSTDCCGGQLTDRWQGTYTLQVTRAADPGLTTADTGDPATGWVTLGTIRFQGQDAAFRPWLRHQFTIETGSGAPVTATGLRIKVSDPNTSIDELEVNGPGPVQPLSLSVTRQANGLTISWTGGGALESADVIGGPWSPVAGGAESPFTMTGFPGTQKFYRLRQ